MSIVRGALESLIAKATEKLAPMDQDKLIRLLSAELESEILCAELRLAALKQIPVIGAQVGRIFGLLITRLEMEIGVTEEAPVEPPKAEEAPKAEPKTEPVTEAPKAEPAAEAPKTEAPKTEAPKSNGPSF